MFGKKQLISLKIEILKGKRSKIRPNFPHRPKFLQKNTTDRKKYNFSESKHPTPPRGHTFFLQKRNPVHTKRLLHGSLSTIKRLQAKENKQITTKFIVN